MLPLPPGWAGSACAWESLAQPKLGTGSIRAPASVASPPPRSGRMALSRMCIRERSGSVRTSTPSDLVMAANASCQAARISGAFASRLGADHLMAVLDAVQLTVGGDLAGPLLPVQPVYRVLGYRPKSLE